MRAPKRLQWACLHNFQLIGADPLPNGAHETSSCRTEHFLFCQGRDCHSSVTTDLPAGRTSDILDLIMDSHIKYDAGAAAE